MAYILSPTEREQRARLATLLDKDDAGLVAAQSEGRALTLEQAVAYALNEHD